MNEEWKEIKGFEGKYMISSFGNVRSLKTNRNIYQRPDKGGYMTCLLFKSMQISVKKIHRLVAEAFIPNSLNKKEVNHIDFNPSNNNVSNLEWCSPKENIQHSISNGRWKRKISNRKGNNFACKKIIGIYNNSENLFNSIEEAMIYYKLSRTAIYRCLSGKQLSTRNGISFKYSP